MDTPTVFGVPGPPVNVPRTEQLKCQKCIVSPFRRLQGQDQGAAGPCPQLLTVSRLVAASPQCSRGFVCVCVPVPKVPLSTGAPLDEGPEVLPDVHVTNAARSDPISNKVTH